MSVCAPEVSPRSIAGGFVLVSVATLMTAWRACQARPLGIGDFRAWLACHELEARRGVRGEGRSPSYGVAELAKLLGVTKKRARASVNRLVVAGLIQWFDSAIGFLDPRVERAEGLDDTIGRGRGNLAIPRRMLRFLVDGARPAIIATVLGILLRCLSRRKDGFGGRGRVKASWIARTFGISTRQVKAARAELISLGWIEAQPGDQWAENRWGRAFRIDLGWKAPDSGASSSPLPAVLGPSSSPPDLHQEPSLTGGSRNQEPAGGPTGFSISGQPRESGAPTTRRDRPPVMLTDVQASPGLCSGLADLPAPKLVDVRLEDLKDTGRLLDLYRQAVARGLVGTSEHDRLRFIGAAEHALAIASNAPALFAWLVLRGCWRYITGADEDRANARIKAYLRGPEPAPIASPPRVYTAGIPVPTSGPPRVRIEIAPLASSRPIESGGLSEDARIVKAIREATIRAGIYRDPWATFQARYPEWDRGRWDAALAELGLA
jgi:hypothetical protein